MIRTTRIPGAIASLLSLALIAGCASSPADEAPATQGYVSIIKIEGDPDRMVCRSQQETGLRLSSRVCKTARECEQERHDNLEAIRNANQSGVRPSDMPSAVGRRRLAV